MIAHRVTGISLLVTGDFVRGRAHLDRSISLYELAQHRPLATRFGHDNRVATLSYRSLALWGLGCPEAALTDTAQLLKNASEIGQAATLMYALYYISMTLTLYGDYATASARADEVAALADKSGSLTWKAVGMMGRGALFALTGKASDAVDLITSGVTTFRSTGGTLFAPFSLSHLARAYAQLGHLDNAWRCVGEAITTVQTTKERWFERPRSIAQPGKWH